MRDWLDEAPAGHLLRWAMIGALCLGGLGGWAVLAPPASGPPPQLTVQEVAPNTLRRWREREHLAGGEGKVRVGSLNLDLAVGRDTYVYLSVDRVPAACAVQACQLVLETAEAGEAFALAEPGIGISRPMAMMMPFKPAVLGPHHLRAAIRTVEGTLATSDATRYWSVPSDPRPEELLEAGVGGLLEPRLLLLLPGLLLLFVQLGARRRRRIPDELQLMYRIEDADPASIASPSWQVVPVGTRERRPLRELLRDEGGAAVVRQLAAAFRRPEISVADLLELRDLVPVEVKLRPGEEGEVRIESSAPFGYRRQSEHSATHREESGGEVSLPLGSLLAVDRVQLVLGYPEMVEAMREGILRVPEVPRLPKKRPS
ncbi:MAG: hypothetical protein P1V51_04580 [Deltaproteobacteria bacterium]|nr:hypothetical protein [Deltaproteobacteria bacterium]